ncbi:MAG: universal stress protein [Ekhidna sp.]|uniref:universal stress protein n=1 Tax=Ekhidna sp. TaxID=2608089 RepID=UPI0032EF8FC9
MKKILVPVDFSEVSGHATRFAIQIAESFDAEITLLNSVQFYYFTDYEFASFSGAKTLMQDVKDAMVKKMDEFVKGLDSKCKINTIVNEDSLIGSIKTMVAEEGYNLVVVGTHGSSGLEEVFIGSNTEKIVRNTDCPVISVPSPTSVKKIKRILIPLDIREIKASFLDKVAALQDKFAAKIEFLWVKTPHNVENEQSVSKELSKILKEHGIDNYEFTIVNNVFPSDGILMHAYDTEADMVAMATHARRGISHWLSGSLAEDTINHIKIPVWTFKLNKKEKAITLDSVKNAHGKPEYKKIQVLTS